MGAIQQILAIAGSSAYVYHNPTWTSVVGASNSSNVLTKTAGSGWGNCGAVSNAGFGADCRLAYYWQFPFENNKMCGIGTDSSCTTYATIDYGVNLENGILSARINLYQNGSGASSTDIAALSGADGNILIEVERVGTTVKVYTSLHTGPTPAPGGTRTLRYTASGSSTGTLLVNVAMDVSGTVFSGADFDWVAI